MTFGFSQRLLCAGLATVGLAVIMPAGAAHAQDGLVMRDILGRLGILPEEKEPIEYRERPGLVVPKDMDKLRAPETAEAHAKNPQWPSDPDVKAREADRARRAQGYLIPRRTDPFEGARMSMDDIAAGRSVRGAKLGEASVPANDKGTIRLSVQEMEASGKLAAQPTYPPGTEPPRRYLTDPPAGLRLPSAAAPAGRRTTEGQILDNGKVGDAWRRLD